MCCRCSSSAADSAAYPFILFGRTVRPLSGLIRDKNVPVCVCEFVRGKERQTRCVCERERDRMCMSRITLHDHELLCTAKQLTLVRETTYSFFFT